jgi:uncharacterized delta-60 repeat protein
MHGEPPSDAWAFISHSLGREKSIEVLSCSPRANSKEERMKICHKPPLELINRLNSRSTGLMLVFLLSVARLFSQTVDSFNPNPQTGGGSLDGVAFQPDNAVLAFGVFATFGGQPRPGLARSFSDGTLDLNFNPNGSYPGGFLDIVTVSVQTDHRLLVGGNFRNLGGRASTNLARLFSDGTADPSFNAWTDLRTSAIILQADGRILVSGRFTQINGQPHLALARLNSDGTLDTNFTAEAKGNSAGIGIQPDGKILVCGTFTNLAGQACTNIGLLNADGTADATFHASASSGVGCMVIQNDGKIVIGGPFTTLNGQPRNYLGRLNSDGSLDTGFNPNPDFYVVCLALQADGKILVSGGSTNIYGQVRTSLARLNSDGSLDTSFDPSPITAELGQPVVNDCHLQVDGRIVVAGNFWALNGQTRGSIGRYINPDPATQSLTMNGSTITWLRGGTSPEVWRTTFEQSTDGIIWILLGSGTRIAGGWQLNGASVPSGAAIRARGFIVEAGRCWYTETLSQPLISLNDGSFGFQSNHFGFNVNGTPGQTVVVSGSSNLVNWTPLTTNTLGLSPFYFSDPASANLTRRLYRVQTH